MKKIHYLLVLVLMAAIISACSSAPAATSTSATQPAAALSCTPVPVTQTALSENLTLRVGTLELDGTSSSVDAEQAAELLPLWKALRTLSQSESTAIEELEAVLDQISETMTEEQLAAISAMQLTREDMAALMQEYGLSSGIGTGEGPSPERQATAQALRDSGQMPAGGGFFGGQGGGPGAGQGLGEGALPPGTTGTDSATTRTRAAQGFNSPLYDVVIEYLESLL